MNMKTSLLLLTCLVLHAGPALGAHSSAPDRIDFSDLDVFPESITATASGDLLVSSAGNGSVYRLREGETVAEVWLSGEKTGIKEMLGIFAHEASDTIFACSIGMNAPPEEADNLSALYSFDLQTGILKAKHRLPGGAKSLCNDIAVDAHGYPYISDTVNGRVLVRGDDGTVREWLADPRLAGINGIAFGEDGALYINSMTSGRMFRIVVNADATPGEIRELATTLELSRPDGLRALGGMRFVQAENGGRIAIITIENDTAKVTPVRSGEGWSGVTYANGRFFAVNPKAQYRMDPALAGQDPNPFFIDAFDAEQ